MTAKKPTVTKADRAKAASQIASVTPLRGGRGRGSRSVTKARPNATRPADLDLLARRNHAVNLRRLGLQWQQVAQQIRDDPTFGAAVPRYSAADACNDVKAILDQVTVEAALNVRQEDLATLASMQRQVLPMLSDPALAPADRLRALRGMVQILDRRASYLGLDAPIKHQLTGADGGPIVIDTTDDAAIYAAALAALDDTLPHVEPMQLPAGP